ncbi:MAG TPA: redoxin domain-containing protein [Candidatus Eremiobacteraeota bacterium]|nr:MAG: Thiol-disulfide oxidoreductase ResA [bacterium ADurb.Bin363]HPZ10598.1 redoxin domain-containing protein [Candidatus Eremiobacteraeota bacterium]
MTKEALKYPALFLFIVFTIFIHYIAKSPNLSEPELASSGNQTVSSDVGKIAPDFRMENLSGGQMSIAEFTGKKSVILYFWSCSIPLCDESLSELEEFYNKNSEKVEILAVNVGDLRFELEKFLKNKNYKINILFDSNGMGTLSYEITEPTLILIDKNNTITYIYKQNKKDERLKNILEEVILPLLK